MDLLTGTLLRTILRFSMMQFAEGDGAGGGEGEGTGSESSGGEGTGTVDWKSSLSEDIRTHPSMEKFKTPEDVAKSYIEIQKVVGKDKVVLPTKDSTPEEISEFYSKIGRPESFDKYNVPELGDDVKPLMSESRLETFKQIAFENGITEAQFAKLVEGYANDTKVAMDSFAEQQELETKKQLSALMQEWGPKMEENQALSKKAIRAFTDDAKLIESIEKNPGLVKVFAQVGQAMSNDSLVNKGTTMLTVSKAEMQAEIGKAISGDKDSAYWNAMHPEHKETKQKITEYYRKIAEIEAEEKEQS